MPVEPQLYRVALVRQELQVSHLVGGARLRRARPAALGLNPVDPVFQPVAVGVVDQRDFAVRVAGELVVVVPGGHPELGVFAVQREPLVPLSVVQQPCFAVQKRLDVVIANAHGTSLLSSGAGRLGGRSGDKLAALFVDGAQHFADPVLVVQHVEPFVFRGGAAEQGLHVDRLGRFIGAFDPLLGPAGEVVPFGQGAVVAFLAGAELFEVVGGAHAGDVEEVFVLTDAHTPIFGGFAFGGEAVDGDFGFVHGDGTDHAYLGGELIHQIDVGVEAEVARLIDDRVGAGFTQLLLDPVLMLIDRAHFRVKQPGPQHHVAVFVGVEAAFALRPTVGIHRFGATGIVITALHGGGVVPVHGADVVAIGAVFSLQLPVAGVGVGGGAAQDLQAFRGLVDDVVDDLGGFAQMLFERLYVVTQAAEQKAFVVFKAREALEVVGAILFEVIRVGAIFLVFGFEQLTVVFERPAVERAGESAFVAAFAAA